MTVGTESLTVMRPANPGGLSGIASLGYKRVHVPVVLRARQFEQGQAYTQSGETKSAAVEQLWCIPLAVPMATPIMAGF